MAAPQTMKRDRIVEGLRRQILSGELPRGTRVPQDELARQFEASITPVREALRLLEAEGLLVSEPHRGARVASVNLDKVKAVYIIRRLLESYAMQRAVTRMSQHDLKQVRALVDEMDTAVETDDADTFRNLNKEFHFFFYRRCGNPALADQIDALWQGFPWDLLLTTPDRVRESQREHRAILDAVEAGDIAGAASATERHIAQGFDGIARRLSDTDHPVPDPFDLDVD